MNGIDMQIARISEMESYLDRSEAAVKALDEALSGYEEVLDDYHRLEDYYGSPAWRTDFEADEEGLLPEDLRRGVLSEDAVYDLVTEQKELLERMERLLFSMRNRQLTD